MGNRNIDKHKKTTCSMPYHNQYDLGAVRSGAHTIPHQNNANLLCKSVLSNLTQNHIIPCSGKNSTLQSEAHKRAILNDNVHISQSVASRELMMIDGLPVVT